jgi:hypothetical protein
MKSKEEILIELKTKRAEISALELSLQLQGGSEKSPPAYKTPTPLSRHVAYELPDQDPEHHETKEEKEEAEQSTNVESEEDPQIQAAIQQDILNRLAAENAEAERREQEAREAAIAQREQEDRVAFMLLQQRRAAEEQQRVAQEAANALAERRRFAMEEAERYGI